jgi:hypothetical protein
MTDNDQKDETVLFTHLDSSSPNASLIIQIPTIAKTIKTAQALKETIHL